jgi:pre-rRNA-processing protein TSR3
MSRFLPTIILRHKKENLKKCSLRGLEPREDLRFFTYPHKMDFSLDGYVMLHLGDENTKELSI